MGEVDPRAICPTSGNICNFKLALIDEFEVRSRDQEESEYAEMAFSHPSDDFDPDFDEDYSGRSISVASGPHSNGVKLAFQLGEVNNVAKVISCPGSSEESSCPARDRVDNSKHRKGILKQIRKVISWV